MTTINGIGGFNPNQFLDRAQGRFNAADVDGNGEVTKAEFTKQVEGVELPQSAEKIFNRLDGNGDGVITAQEQREALQQFSERIGQLGPGGLSSSKSINTFQSLLESIANSENDSERAENVESLMNELKKSIERADAQGINQALSDFNQLYPKIDTRV